MHPTDDSPTVPMGSIKVKVTEQPGKSEIHMWILPIYCLQEPVLELESHQTTYYQMLSIHQPLTTSIHSNALGIRNLPHKLIHLVYFSYRCPLIFLIPIVNFYLNGF